MTIQFRTINALFNQRFLLGMYAPIVLEFVVYAIYLTAKGEPLNWGILFWALMAIAPALFIYIISPILIYYISGIGKHYKQNLQDHIDSLFIFSGDLEGMDEKTKDEIYKKIDNQLIPKLVNNLRFTYIDSYISRSRHSQKEILFTNFETLFLFSITWSILSLFDFIGVIILHFQPIVLDFIVIDTIDNIVNVIIFAMILGILTIASDFLAYYSLTRLQELMLESLPIVTHIEEEEKWKRYDYIRSISNFPLENYFDHNFIRKYSESFEPIFRDELDQPLGEAIRFYARNQVGKQQAWRLYKPLLETLDVSDEHRAVIKGKFFQEPFYEIAREVFSYDHEVNSLKMDIEYVKNRLSLWKETSEEERATALVFLFRSSEQLFKSIIERLEAPIEVYSNFSMMLSFLTEKEFITREEEEVFNNIRNQRNTLVHQSGRLLKIKKKEIEEYLSCLEKVLLRIEKYFEKEEKE